MLLFGAFFVWSIYARIALERRGDHGAPPSAAFTRADAIDLVVGTVLGSRSPCSTLICRRVGDRLVSGGDQRCRLSPSQRFGERMAPFVSGVIASSDQPRADSRGDCWPDPGKGDSLARLPGFG